MLWVKGFSFIIDNNIAGGFLNGWQYYGTDSTELISFSPPLARKGPITLPYRIREHCTVLIGDYVYLIGGYSATFKAMIKKVLAINIHNGEMRYMAEMNYVHRSHTCATISRGNKTLIIVAGGIESTTPWGFGCIHLLNTHKYCGNTWKMCSPASVILASIVPILISFEQFWSILKPMVGTLPWNCPDFFFNFHPPPPPQEGLSWAKCSPL